MRRSVQIKLRGYFENRANAVRPAPIASPIEIPAGIQRHAAEAFQPVQPVRRKLVQDTLTPNSAQTGRQLEDCTAAKTLASPAA